jgi:hypothetical protein
MVQHEWTHRLGGEVLLDDAYLRGERAGGKGERGSENKIPLVAAVWLNDAGHPIYAKLSVLSGFRLVLSVRSP